MRFEASRLYGHAPWHAPSQGVYRAYISNSRNMTAEGAATLGLLRRCAVELYGLDTEASYEHAFTYLRQLAELLRGALAAKTRDAFREVYCWQTMNALDLWTALVSAHADSPVRPPGLGCRCVLSSAARKRRVGTGAGCVYA